MTHEDELYNIEDDDRLTSEGRLALAMVREHHVTYRHAISAMIALFGEDLIEKVLKSDIERERVRAQIDTRAEAEGSRRVKGNKNLSDIAKKMKGSYLDTLNEMRKDAQSKNSPIGSGTTNAYRASKNSRVCEPDQDVQPVPDEALDPEDRGDSVTDGQGGSEG